MVREKIQTNTSTIGQIKGLDADTDWLSEEIRRAEYV